MKRVHAILAAAAVLALSTAAFAGEGHPCTASTQECLNKMASNMASYGWSGLDGDYDEAKGLFTVAAVEGPAAEAGIEPGDVLFGINGHEFASMNDEDWKAIKGDRTPGKTVVYMAKRSGAKKKFEVTLTSMPEDLVAKKVGKHMMQHAVASVQ